MGKRIQRGVWRVGLLVLALALVSLGAEPADRTSYVNLSFDQVNIRQFVKLVGDMTGRTFIVDDGVKGSVTIVTPAIPQSQVYPLFLSVLESSGCTVLVENGVYRVTQLPPRDTPSAPIIGVNETLPRDGLLTKVILLKYVSATDMRKMLESKVGGKGSAIVALESTNHLIITDTADSIRKLERIIEEVDKPGLSRVTEVIQLRYAGAEELAQQLSQALAGAEQAGDALVRRLPKVSEGSEGRRRGVIVVSAPHSNSLIVVGMPSDVAEIRDMVKLMDVASPSGQGRLHAVFLKYISADETAKSLNALLDKTAEKRADQTSARKIAIEGNMANNALLIDATPRDFELVQTLIGELDRIPEQVLIEVLIAEISLNDALDIGVEMAALNLPATVGDTVVQAGSSLTDGSALLNAIQNGIFPNGITFGVAHGAQLDSDGKVVADHPAIMNINALRTKGKIKILSNIPLLAQNNKEASVSVVNNIPILKSTIQGGSGTSRDVIQNIDRVDVGIKLKITPHINPSREVSMLLNPSIEAVVDTGATSSSLTPTVARREVSTTVTVPDGSMIVISGLIREDQTRIVRKFPVLGSMPLIGWLFRHTTSGRDRTNLLVFVTPHIVTDSESAKAVKDAWEKLTGISPTNTAENISELK